MDVEGFVRAYYDALRDGDPLAPFFADRADVVKVGISERLVGSDCVAAGLAAQTARTTAWAIESRDLHATTVGDHGWFADDVFMAWTDTERSVRYEFDARWSGTVVRLEETDGADAAAAADAADAASEQYDGWRFVGMHVSVSRSL